MEEARGLDKTGVEVKKRKCKDTSLKKKQDLKKKRKKVKKMLFFVTLFTSMSSLHEYFLRALS